MATFHSKNTKCPVLIFDLIISTFLCAVFLLVLRGQTFLTHPTKMSLFLFTSQGSREFWVEPVEGGGDQTEQTHQGTLTGKLLGTFRRIVCTLNRTVKNSALCRKTSSCEVLCSKLRRTSLSSCLIWTSWRTCMQIRKLNMNGKRPSLRF